MASMRAAYSLSFVEPYLLDYRVALGLDVFYREQLPNNLHLVRHQDASASVPRLGFALREDLSLQLRYSIYQQEISLPSQLDNCNNTRPACWPSIRRRPISTRCSAASIPPATRRTACCRAVYGDGEASLPVRKELANGATLTSAVGYSLNYNTLDNNKNPTDGLLIDFKQDFAGVGGDVSYLKTAIDAKYYTPLVADIVGLVHLQGGMLNKVGNSRASHARPVPDGSESGPRLCAQRHRSARHQFFRTPDRRRARRHQILGRIGRIADAVLVPAEGSRV